MHSNSPVVQGLLQEAGGDVQRIAALCAAGPMFRIAAIDQDVTIVESYKRVAFDHYQGGRAYQPLWRCGRKRIDRRGPVP